MRFSQSAAIEIVPFWRVGVKVKLQIEKIWQTKEVFPRKNRHTVDEMAPSDLAGRELTTLCFAVASTL
jgi:hypothetical protein